MRMSLLATGLLLVCMVASESHAGPPRRSRRQIAAPNCVQCSGDSCSITTTAPPEPVTRAANAGQKSTEAPKSSASECAEALDEVNAARVARGLKPFVHDPLLSKAAYACAKTRAASHIHGHLQSDFAYLPSGASARAAGCGALDTSWGWGTCCTYDNYTYAGAAWVMGSDGRRYMHLFVR